MKRLLLLLPILLFIGIFYWRVEFLLLLPDSNFKFKWLLYFKEEMYEGYAEIAQEANNTEYKHISWSNSGFDNPEVYLDAVSPRVQNPDISEIIKIANKHDIPWIRINYFNNGWLVHEIEHYSNDEEIIFLTLYHGLMPDIKNCDGFGLGSQKEDFCFYSLFDNWYMISERVVRHGE